MAPVRTPITGTDVLAFHSAELLEAHRLLDTIGVSRSGYEEQLTISQRVAEAVHMVQQLRRRLGE